MDHTSLAWERDAPTPFLTLTPGGLAEEAVTTPDILYREGKLHLYVGAIAAGHERLLVTTLQPDWLGRYSQGAWATGASIAIDTGPHRFDSLHVFDPASVTVDGKVLLYYTAVGPDGDVLGMASSDDGRYFTKHERPIIEGRSPEVVHFGGQFHLFYVKTMPGRGYAIFSSVSRNGEDFSPVRTSPVFDVGPAGSWDSFEVTTPRIFRHNDAFYMVYAAQGDPALKDIPHAFGLARCSDLTSWERYPGNPVFQKGHTSAWDDGAIWFGTVFAWEDKFYLMYEGCSARAIQQPGPAVTQVGLAHVAVDTFDAHMASWPSGD
ncbi:MAG: hypothetical protein ACC700_15190 [Anaerolineales bacterium]